MYRAIVARRVRATFSALSRGDIAAVQDGFAASFTYVFYGDHALGGQRHRVDTMAAWWQRVFTLFPKVTFTPQDVLVGGPPWRTTVITNVTIQAQAADGTPYTNAMMQLIRLRWGRVTEIRTLEDTQRLVAELDRLAGMRIDGAHGAPLSDP